MAGACDGKVGAGDRRQQGTRQGDRAAIGRRRRTVGLTARTLEPDPKYRGSLRQTLDEITTAGGTAIAIQADLSKSEDRGTNIRRTG